MSRSNHRRAAPPDTITPAPCPDCTTPGPTWISDGLLPPAFWMTSTPAPPPPPGGSSPARFGAPPPPPPAAAAHVDRPWAAGRPRARDMDRVRGFRGGRRAVERAVAPHVGDRRQEQQLLGQQALDVHVA